MAPGEGRLTPSRSLRSRGEEVVSCLTSLGRTRPPPLETVLTFWDGPGAE